MLTIGNIESLYKVESIIVLPYLEVGLFRVYSYLIGTSHNVLRICDNYIHVLLELNYLNWYVSYGVGKPYSQCCQ